MRSKKRKVSTAPTNHVACRTASVFPDSFAGWPRDGAVRELPQYVIREQRLPSHIIVNKRLHMLL